MSLCDIEEIVTRYTSIFTVVNMALMITILVI